MHHYRLSRLKENCQIYPQVGEGHLKIVIHFQINKLLCQRHFPNIFSILETSWTGFAASAGWSRTYSSIYIQHIDKLSDLKQPNHQKVGPCCTSKCLFACAQLIQKVVSPNRRMRSPCSRSVTLSVCQLLDQS